MGRCVTLLDERGDHGSSFHLSAEIGKRGELRLEGQDLGPATDAISPDGEYEYFYSVSAKNLPALITALGGAPGEDILDLLAERWSGERAHELGQAIRDSGVRYNFHSYP